MFHLQRIICIGCLLLPMLVASSAVAQSAAPKLSPKEVALTANLKQAIIKRTNIQKELDRLESLKKAAVAEIAVLESKNVSGVVSIESYPEVIRSLHGQRVQFLISVAGLDARRDALVEAQQELAEKSEASSQEVFAPMQETVKLRSQLLDNAKKMSQSGKATQTKVLQAQIDLLEAKTKLAQAKSVTRSNATLDKLRQSLLDTSLELADQKARLDKTVSLIETVEPIHQLESEISKAKRNAVLKEQAIDDKVNKLRASDREIQILEADLRRLQKN